MREDYTIWDVEQELRPTKMVVVDLLRSCQNFCTICYHRYTTFDAPKNEAKYWTKSLDEVKCELKEAKERGCNCSEKTGGEPLLHPNIVEIIEYSKSLDIEPRLITNGNHDPKKYDEVIKAGCNNFLFSFHNIAEEHDDMTQVKGSYERMVKCLRHIIKQGCKYSTNTVIYNNNYNKLPSIINQILQQPKLPTHINIINCNPQYSPTDKLAHRNISAKVSETKEYLQKAIDLATDKNVWVNVRYFPMCNLDEDYRKHICNFPQVFFDWKNEWDYGHNNKTVGNYLTKAHNDFINVSSYNEGDCMLCGIKNVCGGINKSYIDCYGTEELTPQIIRSNNPNFYRSKQEMTTIIIPCYNPSKNLSRLLTEIQFKTHPPYNLVLIRGQRSASLNRNQGLQSISEDSAFVIQLDDDICELPIFWNKRLTDRLLYDPELMAVSARLMTTSGLAALNSANNFNTQTEYEEVNMIPTACFAARVSDIKRSKIEFDKHFVASGWEDTAFFDVLKHHNKKLGLGTKIIIDNNCKVIHINNSTGQNKWNSYNKQVYKKIIDDLV